MSHNYLITDSSPFHNYGLFDRQQVGDGADEWNPLLPGTSMLPSNNTKAPGVHERAGDVLGKLAPTNPLFIGPQLKVASNHVFGGDPLSWSNDVNYRNRMREIRHDLFDFTTDFRLTAQHLTRSSVPLPNVLPAALQ
jgi:hypothetical protein